MSGLFGMLSTTSRALDSQRYGLDVTGQNIANVNTPGYARRSVVLGAVPPADQRMNAGGGVEVTKLRSIRDGFYDRRVLQEVPFEQREGAIVDSLSLVEAGLGTSGASIDARLSQFFSAWGELSEAPTSSTARSAVVAQGQALASQFNDTAQRLTEATQQTDARVRTTIDDVNSLARQIASLNERISSSGASGTLTLQDEQKLALKQLSELVDIDTIENADGTVQVSYGLGRPLVISNVTYEMRVVNEPVSGLAQIYHDTSNATGEIRGGKLAGLLQTRDTLIPAYRNKLDTLAYEVVQQVNTLHDAGFTQSGVDAPVFFQPLASATNAAASLAVNAAVVSDPSLLAAASVTGTPGDNTQARALANLRDARPMNGGTTTFGDFWTELVYQAGQDRSIAETEQKTRGEVVRQIENLRDSVSGVSLDEEAASMMKFQRAYEANARFFSIVNQTLDVLLGMGR
jgi:flagellar hook-associated protein 1